MVPAGGSVRVYVGCGENSAARPGRFFWCQKDSVFENADGRRHSGDGGYLFDPRGNLRASMIYPCLVGCTSALAGKVDVTVHPTTPESIAITNVSAEPVDLAGNLLKLHLNGMPKKFIWGYPFGAGTLLVPGESLRVLPDGSPALDTPLERHLGRGPYRADGRRQRGLPALGDRRRGRLRGVGPLPLLSAPGVMVPPPCPAGGGDSCGSSPGSACPPGPSRAASWSTGATGRACAPCRRTSPWCPGAGWSASSARSSSSATSCTSTS